MEEKTITLKEVEDTMACSAFAEANEPCPIGTEEETAEPRKTGKTAEEEEKSTAALIEDTMACTAFAEAGEPCPIGNGE